MEMQDNLQEADGNKKENNKGCDLKKKHAPSNEIPSKKTNLKDKKKELVFLNWLVLLSPKWL